MYIISKVTGESALVSEKVDKIILQMLIKAGVDGKATVFLFSDNQIKEESFVEDINMILNTGDVPNIFPADEKADVIEKMQTVARVEVREKITPVCLIDQLRFLDLHVVENSIPKLAHKDAKFFGVFHAYYSQGKRGDVAKCAGKTLVRGEVRASYFPVATRFRG